MEERLGSTLDMMEMVVAMPDLQFDDFVVFQKTLELIDRYGIKPKNVSFDAFLVRTDNFDEEYHWHLSSHLGTPPEQLERLERLYADLGIQDTNGKIVVDDAINIHDILYEAIEKAPKSFASRFR